MADLRGGIDLGGTKIQTVVVEPDGTLRGEAGRPTPHSGGQGDVARAMARRDAGEGARHRGPSLLIGR